MSRTFVSFNKTDNTITIKHDDGMDHAHSVDPKVAVTLNGKPSELSELKAGDELTYQGDPITSIAATR